MNSLQWLSEPTPSSLFGNLPVLKVKFSIHIPQRSRLPIYLGSTWRGMIGWEMQRLICPFDRRPECKSCTIQGHCPYYLLFEQETLYPGIRDAPRGYILYPPVSSQDQHEQLEITLIGHCSRLLPVLVAAVMEGGGSSGLGVHHDRYDVMDLQEQLPDGSYQSLSATSDAVNNVSGPFPLSDWIDKSSPVTDSQVLFLTPVRLRKGGKYITQMDWPFFFTTIACRLEALNCLFHTGEPLGRETFMKLKTLFEPAAQISADLQWTDYARFSNRQNRKVRMGGLVGIARRPPSDQLAPWWRAVSLLHAGKGASMGLGRVEMMA